MDYLGLDEEILKNMEMARKANIAVQNNNLDYAVGIFVKVNLSTTFKNYSNSLYS